MQNQVNPDQLGYSYDSEEIYENAVSLSALINEKNNNKNNISHIW